MGRSILKNALLVGLGVITLSGGGAFAQSCPPPGAGTCGGGFSDFVNVSTTAGFSMRVGVLTEAQEAAGTLSAPFSITVPAGGFAITDAIIEGSTPSDSISYN